MKLVLFTTLFVVKIHLVLGDSISSPELFKPLLVKDFPQIRDFALSPSGNEIYFSVTSFRNELSFILFISKNSGVWSDPEVVGFSGSYNDIEPAFSPDGKRLYFASQRPISDSSEKPKDYDIWFVERIDEQSGWSKPKNMGEPINTSENEFYPSLAESGNIYFTSKREDVKGGEDLYVCYFDNNKYSEPVNLGDSINSKMFEFNAFVAPDESFIIFSSFGRSGAVGGGDLYISRKNENGVWGKSINLGANINSESLDYCPFVDIKNRKLYYTSRRNNFPEYFEEPLKRNELIKILNQPQNGLDRIYMIEFDYNLP